MSARTSSRGKQFGLTFLGMLVVLGIGAFFALLLIKCVPIYLNQFAVARAVRDVAAKNSVAGEAEPDPEAIRAALQRRWDIDYISRITAADIKLVRDEHGLALAYDYEAREHLLYNVSVVIHFADAVPIRGGAD